MSLEKLLTIDLSNTTEQEVGLARAVGHACRTVSTFLVEDPLHSSKLVTNTRTLAGNFFNLPLKEKLALHRDGAGLGYLPEGTENLAATIGVAAPPDPKETFNIGSDPTKNRWPKNLPEFETTLLQYYKEMWRISRQLMRLFSLALGMSYQFLEERSAAGNSILRATRYPKLQFFPPDNALLRAGPHTDYGLFSLVQLDQEVGGFEIKPPGESWTEVRSSGNRLAVNIGDLLMRYTNGAWPATLHRVTAPEAFAAHDRLSFVFLHNPNPDAIISPLDTFLSMGEPPLFQPVIAGEYLRAKSKKGLSKPGEVLR